MILGLIDSGVIPTKKSSHHQIFFNREKRKDASTFWNKHHTALCNLMSWQSIYSFTVKQYISFCRLKKTCHCFEECTFSGSIGSYECYHLTNVNTNAHPVK